MSGQRNSEERSAADESPIVDAELLSDVESRYVTDWLAHARRADSGEEPSRALVVRSGAALLRRVEVARRAGELVRRVDVGRRLVVGRTVAAWRAAPAVHARKAAGYRLRKAPADALRLLWFVLRGNWRWLVKVWAFITYADLRADARAARLAGDVEARRTAQELIRADARERWARLAMVVESSRRVPALVTSVTLVRLLTVIVVSPSRRRGER